MILSVDPIDLNIASIVRATRKQFGLSQTDLARKLGLTQSTYSRAENSKSLFNVFQWDDFCSFFGLHHHCYKFGYVDEMSFQRDIQVPNSFHMPKRYRGSEITVQDVLPTLDFFAQKMGRNALKDLLKSYCIDPDYFIYRFNKISLQFQIDITKYLIQMSQLDKTSMRELSKLSSNPFFHGSSFEKYNQNGSTQSNIETFVGIVKNNQNFTSLEIDDLSSSHIHLKRKYNIDKVGNNNLKYDSILGDFFCEYFQQSLQQISQINLPSPAPISIEHTDCYFKDAKECRYQIRVA